MLRISPYAYAALSGALLSLAYPPFGIGVLGCVGLVPLWYLCQDVLPGEALRRGLVWGAAFHAATVIWIFWATAVGGALAFVYLIACVGVFSVLLSLGCRRWGRRWVYFAPVLWFAWEYLRSIGVLGFPWLNLAHTMTYASLWIQMADLGGAHGVSLWATICNGLVYWTIESWRNRSSLKMAVCLLVVWGAWPGLYGAWRLAHLPPVNGTISIGVVQGNIDAGQRWSQEFKEVNYHRQARLSLELKEEEPALVVWSESAAISYLRYDKLYRTRFRQLADSLESPIFTGALDFESNAAAKGHSYNAAFLIRPGDAPLERYAKRQLVPFGEHNPLEYRFPILQKLDFGQANFSPGPDTTVFEIPGLRLPGQGVRHARFGALICFESIFPELTRAYRDKKIDFLVIITNDGWYGRFSAAYQHAQAAVYRAVETRRPIARCANTGVSFFIDFAGRVVKPSPIYEEWASVAQLETSDAETVYSRYGDVLPPWIVGIACLGLVTLFLPKHGRNSEPGRNNPSELKV